MVVVTGAGGTDGGDSCESDHLCVILVGAGPTVDPGVLRAGTCPLEGRRIEREDSSSLVTHRQIWETRSPTPVPPVVGGESRRDDPNPCSRHGEPNTTNYPLSTGEESGWGGLSPLLTWGTGDIFVQRENSEDHFQRPSLPGILYSESERVLY